MKNLTIRQMRYFDALMRHGQFSRAAEACAISQPALSMQIREMETAIGGPLFERGGRQVRLTRLGEAIAPRIREVLRTIDEIGEVAENHGDRPLGRLRLGVIPTVAPYLLPGVIGRLGQSHPGLDLHVRETVTPRLIHDLEEGRLDTAIVALPVSQASMDEQPLFSENFVLVRPGRDAGKPVPDADMLREMRLLLLEEGHCFRDQALSFCALKPSPARELLEGSSLSTLVQMVGAGLGVTLLPQMAVPVETRSADVDIAPFATPQPSRTIGMIWRRTNPLAEHLRDVADIVRDAADAIRDGAAALFGQSTKV